MALLNRKIDYALLIMCYLHHRSEGGSAREIAAHFHLSHPFVANILKSLCHKGFVTSQRGVKGGYLLQHSAHTITLATLMDTLDEAVCLAECNRPQPDQCCSLLGQCPIRDPIAVVHHRIRAVLEGVTLGEIFSQSFTAPPIELEVSRCCPS